MTFGGFDPELVRQISSYVRPEPMSQLLAEDYEGNSRWLASSMNRIASGDTATGVPGVETGPADDTSRAMEIFGGIMSAPFRLVGAGVESLQDLLGAPASYRRQARDAQYDTAQNYLLASQSIPENIKALLPGYLPPTDRAAYVARQTDPSATAVGRDTSGLPTPTPRKTGIWEWITGDQQREQARERAQIQTAMKLAGYDANMRARNAQTFSSTASGLSSLADIDKKALEADILRRYGYDEAAAKVEAERARAAAGYASAADSYAGRDLKHGQLDEVRAEGARTQNFFDTVSLPQGVQGVEQSKRLFDEVTLPAGREDLRQRREMGPLNVQAKEAELAAKGLTGGPSKLEVDATAKMVGHMIDANKNTSLLGRVFGSGGTENVAEGYGLKKKDDGSYDYETWRNQFRPKGGDVYSVYRLLRQRPGASGSEGQLASRAEHIAKMLPTLDFSTEDSFIDTAQAAGLSDDEIVLLWESREQRNP